MRAVRRGQRNPHQKADGGQRQVWLLLQPYHKISKGRRTGGFPLLKCLLSQVMRVGDPAHKAEGLCINSCVLVASCTCLCLSSNSNGQNARLTSICLGHPEWSPLLVHIQGADAAANQGWQIPRDCKCPWPAVRHISASRPVSGSIWQILHSGHRCSGDNVLLSLHSSHGLIKMSACYPSYPSDIVSSICPRRPLPIASASKTLVIVK